MAQDNARRFAELSRALHEAVPQILSAEGTLLEPADDQMEPKEATQESTDEKLWTVDEIAKDAGEAHVDTIIDEILTATEDTQ